ncbi:MAG: hypothetical protein NWR21_09070 [Verrucomicrobiales bacterium]|nr:hypothetical protein [Verrucomicrobiales bacterium]MDP4791380.1 hypothetical protein [Verrucomicrobiales bacterium]MDP4939452.1 hypothetical protein [Verrucomicrobiales bacterium]MDP5006895.1 hypothetical protein [Verrucomicrobiales bacterium]
MIRTLSRGHRVVTHNGVGRYQHGDSYYQPARGGYPVDAGHSQSRGRGWR